MTALGVGVVGAGPVTQAIHLPTLARLRDELVVAHVMDVDATVARSVAARVGASWSTSVEKLLDDPAVEVVAICSPPAVHAEHVRAAIAAGVRGILCEKPFATSLADAQALAVAALESHTPLIVGAMHAFDPAWRAAQDAWGDLAETVHTVRSSIVLPPNRRYEHWASEILAPVPTGEAPDLRGPESRARRFRDSILGLAIHDVPLIRMFAPVIERMSDGEVLEPFGYAVSVAGGGRSVEFFGHMHEHARPAWSVEAWSPHARLRVDFTPSYVHAGSAVATLAAPAHSVQLGPFETNGYIEEWKHLARLARGDPQSAEDVQSIVDDLEYAMRISAAVPLPASLTQEKEART